MNSRMNQFRGRAVKQEALQNNKNVDDINHLFKMILALSQKVFTLENQFKTLFPTAKIADWRSLATVKVLSEEINLALTWPDGTENSFEDLVAIKAEELQIQDFEAQNIQDDKAKDLVPCDDETAQEDHYAIAKIKVFKNGKEIEEQQIVRTKILLGTNELFPELDAALIGMKVGDIKKFALNLQGQTDEAQACLIGLRKKKA